MLRHIVMMKFKDDVQNEEERLWFKEKLTGLLHSVPSLKSMEVGLNISSKASAFDLVLTADFDDKKALNEYRAHPEHVKILDRMKKSVAQVTAVDYLI